MFDASKPILARFKLLHDKKTGYRLLSDDIYTTIWPDESTDDFFGRVVDSPENLAVAVGQKRPLN